MERLEDACIYRRLDHTQFLEDKQIVTGHIEARSTQKMSDNLGIWADQLLRCYNQHLNNIN